MRIKLLVVSLFIAALSTGCGTGRFTGGGWLPSNSGVGKAIFGFNGDNCGGTVGGHITFHDKNAVDYFTNTPIPGGVKIHASVIDTGVCTPESTDPDCPPELDSGGSWALFAYESHNPNRPGAGLGLLFTLDAPNPDPDVIVTLALVQIMDDVYGYVNGGEIRGSIQTHQCE